MKKSEKIKKEILEQMKKFPIIELACQKAQITRMTFLRWRKEDPEFSKEIEGAILQGRQLINDLAEAGLIGKVKDQELPAILNWLKFHHPDYGNKIEISGTIKTVPQMTEDQKEAVKKALALANAVLNKNNDKKDGQ